MQLGFYFDQTRCTGCSACRVACKDWNDIPAGPENWMLIDSMEEGECPEVFVAYMVRTCFHCEDPVCADACPVNAITKRPEDGVVLVDADVCLGREECDSKCLKACPYDAPQFGPEPGAKMGKCNLCHDRIAENKQPACVETCPVRALEVGPLEKLTAEFGDAVEAPLFKYSSRTKPSAAFKVKQRG